MIVFIFQHFYSTRFQCTYQRRVFFQHFKQTGDARQLNAVNLVAEEFSFWC